MKAFLYTIDSRKKWKILEDKKELIFRPYEI